MCVVFLFMLVFMSRFIIRGFIISMIVVLVILVFGIRVVGLSCCVRLVRSECVWLVSCRLLSFWLRRVMDVCMLCIMLVSVG